MPKAKIQYIHKNGTRHGTVKDLDLSFVPRAGEIIHDPNGPNSRDVNTYMVQSVIYHITEDNDAMPLITARSCLRGGRLGALQEYGWLPDGPAATEHQYDEDDLDMNFNHLKT